MGDEIAANTRRATPKVVSILAAAASVGAMAALAAYTDEPLVFPSLGPSAWLLFFSPDAPSSAPRRVFLGHGAGLAAGQLALWITGLAGAPGALVTGVDGARVAAVVLALAGAAAMADRLDAVHPPAAATTLIVALGMLQGPRTLAAMAIAIVLFTAIAVGMRRIVRPRVRPAESATM